MILYFSVKNFRSVKESAELSFTATADRSLSECLITAEKKKALPLIALYGGNASGKSTVINAFIRMRELICGRYSALQTGEPLPFEPFGFSEKCEDTTDFDVEFIHDEIRYRYNYSYNENEIVSEKLYFWPNGRESLIFSRESGKYVFRENVSEQNAVAARTLPNRLYLKTACDWNYQPVLNAFQWFVSGILCMDYESGLAGLNAESDSEWNARIISELKLADSQVCEMSSQEAGRSYDVYSRISDEKIVLVPVEKQSSGFSRYCKMIDSWLHAIKTGAFIVADNFDNNLGEQLTRRLIELVQSRELNPGHAQLLCATHDTSLMDQSLLRRDEIYLTEKLDSGRGTVVHPVTYFSPRKDKRIDFGYRNGEFRIEKQ